MKLQRRQFLHLAAGAAALPAVSRTAKAQTYPTRPITIIVPYAAGGPTDVFGRILAEGMKATLAQPVIVENVGGAGGNLGVGRVVRTAGDGYTLCIGDWGTHVVSGAIYTLPYDSLKDFEPIALLSRAPLIVTAKKALPVNDLKSLIGWLKANPGKAMQGTAGVGNLTHFGGVLLQKLSDTTFQFVPYRGIGPAMLDLVAGQIDLLIGAPSIILPQVRAGAVKAYAVTAKTRLAAAPEIPSADEAGLPGLYISSWRGLWAPKGTPRIAISKLNAAVVDVLAAPSTQRRIADLGEEVPPRDQQTPEALGAFQKAEIEKWWPIIKAAGIKAE